MLEKRSCHLRIQKVICYLHVVIHVQVEFCLFKIAKFWLTLIINDDEYTACGLSNCVLADWPANWEKF